jgi:hypothetical protein
MLSRSWGVGVGVVEPGRDGRQPPVHGGGAATGGHRQHQQHQDDGARAGRQRHGRAGGQLNHVTPS